MSAGKWQGLLQPWAKQLAQVEDSLGAHCRGLDDDQLQRLDDAATYPNRTNCWWAIYQVAPMVKEAVQTERTRRASAGRADR